MFLSQAEDGDILDRMDEFKKLSEDVEERCVYLVETIEELEYNIDAFKDKIARLTSKKKTLEKIKDTLKQDIVEAMIETKKKRISRLDKDIILMEGKEKVDIIDADSIPDTYTEPEVKIKILKNDILKDFKNGIEIAGVKITKSPFINYKAAKLQDSD